MRSILTVAVGAVLTAVFLAAVFWLVLVYVTMD